MRDIFEMLEDSAEAMYCEMLQPDGRLKCGCGRIFNPDNEGGTVSPNPYAMPICGECLQDAIAATPADEREEVATPAPASGSPEDERPGRA